MRLDTNRKRHSAPHSRRSMAILQEPIGLVSWPKRRPNNTESRTAWREPMRNSASVHRRKRRLWPALSLSRRAADCGWPHRAAVAMQWRVWKSMQFVPRGMRAAQGKLFALEGCGHGAQGATAPPPGFTTRQGRAGQPLPNEDMADYAFAQPAPASRGVAPQAVPIAAGLLIPQAQARRHEGLMPRMAATAKTTRGEARKPGGPSYGDQPKTP